MKIAPEKIFEGIKGGPEAYVKPLDYTGKSIEQAKRMLPEGFNIQFESKKDDFGYDENEHPDDEQYAVLSDADPDYYVVHLYVNDDVITEYQEVYR